MTENLNRRGFMAAGSIGLTGTAMAMGSTTTAFAECAALVMPAGTAAAPAGVTAVVERCPVMHGASGYKATGSFANLHWWPNQLNLKLLSQHSSKTDPMRADFNYSKEFNTLDLLALRKDIEALMTTSQDWWPADYGHYGPFFIQIGRAHV